MRPPCRCSCSAHPPPRWRPLAQTPKRPDTRRHDAGAGPAAAPRRTHLNRLGHSLAAVEFPRKPVWPCVQSRPQRRWPFLPGIAAHLHDYPFPAGDLMTALLKISRLIDLMNTWIGKLTMWLVLASVLISAGNAITRKAFNIGSNAFLEIQWYLFAAVFMLGVGYVMLKNAHVRIDFISGKLSKRTNAIIDAVGIVVFTIPLSIIMIDLGWPLFLRTYLSGEMSQNAGGLIRWPVMALVPLGFTILLLQSVSELIKRIGFLTGHLDEPFPLEDGKTAEERLVEELAAQAEQLRLAKVN